MAVVGLHKTSVIDSYLNENHSRPTTRTSFIRKMWRDLENEGKNVENVRVLTAPESPCSSSFEIESIQSEITSIDTNEIETECPKSFEGPTSMNNECKRVRIVREWIESSSQTGQTCSIRRIYGRQAFLDLLKKFEKERKKEVDDLLQNQFVSKFGHRNRIRALLKGRFLRNQRFVEDKKQTSVAASELGLLRQTHSVSDIRKEFISKLNAAEGVQSDSATSSEKSDTTNLTIERHDDDDDDDVWHHLVHNESDEGINVNSKENEHDQWYEEWYDNDDDDDIVENATESGNSNMEAAIINRNNNAFYPSDDENGSRTELRELTNRRRVSNLLQSDFSTQLDQLMQSYVQRQYQSFDSENESQSPNDHLVTDREMIKGLRIDMDTLEQRMEDMQKMVESCMDMQRELQHFVKNEVYSALNPSRVCFLCCDNGFESLPDRSGHMYICSNCANNINWSKLKESVKQR